MNDGFRGPQVCSIVGITYRQLDYWARTDLLRPSLADAKGSGSQRRYSYQDLVELKVIKQLLDAGISLKAARRAVEYLRTNVGEHIGSARLVLSGDNPLLVRDDGQLIDLLRKGQGVLNVVPLEGLVQQLDAAIHEFRRPAAPADGCAAPADGCAAPADGCAAPADRDAASPSGLSTASHVAGK